MAALDAAHVNANLQLAQSALKQRRGADVFACLNHPRTAQQATDYFNPAAFAPPARGTVVSTPVPGNPGGGSGVMHLPRDTNFDATMSKFIPFQSESRGLRLQVQAYNVFNHPEFSGVNSTIQFSATGQITNANTVGVFNGTLPARVMAFSARVQF